MSNKLLNEELLRLRKIGGQETLASELAAFIEAISSSTEQGTVPYSRQFLAYAAQAIQDNALDVAHDYIGASVEAYLQEREGKEPIFSNEILSNLSEDLNPAPEGTFEGVPFPEKTLEGASAFETADEEVVSGFANLLVVAGYVEEARKYLTGYNILHQKGEGKSMQKSEKEVLKKMRGKFKAEANLNMVRVIDQMLSEAEGVGESRASEMLAAVNTLKTDVLKVRAKKAAYMMKAAEEMMKDEESEPEMAKMMAEEAEEEMVKIEKESQELPAVEQPVAPPVQDVQPVSQEVPMPAPVAPVAPVTEDEKPVLEVDAPSAEEEEEKEKAESAVLAGNFKAAREHLRKVAGMERARIIAALTRAGDLELAMEGLTEAEAEMDEVKEDVPPEEKNAGLKAEDKPEGEEELAPAAELAPVAEPVEEVKDREVPAEEGEEEDEKELAAAMAASVTASVKAKDMKKATEALADLDRLEKAVVEGVRVAEQDMKDEALAKEGYETWKAVRKTRLKAELELAEEEKDEEAKQEAMKAMKALEGDEEGLKDSLESEPSEGEEEVPPAPEQPEEAPKALEEESEAMKYEVLQNVDQLKKMRVDRSDLAFTLWDSQEDPYWTVQAAGKPVGEVHLKDQDNAEDIRDFFCDQEKWPNVVAQTTEKVGLYEMLKGIKARFYANEIENSKLAITMKDKAVAELAKTKNDQLANLRTDFTEAVAVAADSLNKGLIPSKPNALKKSFTERLMSLGIHNPALIVEDCFAHGFAPTMEQIISDAQELMEMPKEAFKHTKKMVSAAANVAQSIVNSASNETLAQRLARTSMPLTSVTDPVDAPAIQQEIDAATRKFSDKEVKANLKKRLRLSARF